ncbi:MAG: hypothetical protein U0802_17900 [Candidatus Binatia bacterium]
MAYVGIYHHDQPAPRLAHAYDARHRKVISHDVFTFSVPSTMFPHGWRWSLGPRDVLDRIRGTALLDDPRRRHRRFPRRRHSAWRRADAGRPRRNRWRDLSPATRDVLLGSPSTSSRRWSTRSGEQTEIQRGQRWPLAANGLARLGKE